MVVRGKGPEDAGGGGSLAQSVWPDVTEWGGLGLVLGFRLDVWTERTVELWGGHRGLAADSGTKPLRGCLHRSVRVLV